MDNDRLDDRVREGRRIPARRGLFPEPSTQQVDELWHVSRPGTLVRTDDPLVRTELSGYRVEVFTELGADLLVKCQQEAPPRLAESPLGGRRLP